MKEAFMNIQTSAVMAPPPPRTIQEMKLPVVMMRETPPLGVRPRPEVWDRAIQQPVVVVGFVDD